MRVIRVVRVIRVIGLSGRKEDTRTDRGQRQRDSKRTRATHNSTRSKFTHSSYRTSSAGTRRPQVDTDVGRTQPVVSLARRK